MRIFKPKGTSFWQYEFVVNGKRYHKSTKMTNEREALKIANAAFTALVKGEAGIGEPKSVPTLRAFREDFITAVQAEKQDKPKTVQFYPYSFDSLLKYEPLAEARLDRIDERLVQRFTVWTLARHCEPLKSMLFKPDLHFQAHHGIGTLNLHLQVSGGQTAEGLLRSIAA